MNEVFREKDNKYREMAMRKLERRGVKAVIVPLIISHDGAVHKDTVRRRKDFPRHQGQLGADGTEFLRYNDLIDGKFFNKGSREFEAWRNEPPEAFADEPMAHMNECPRPKKEENY